jgi:HK97 gp10 family phage protein
MANSVRIFGLRNLERELNELPVKIRKGALKALKDSADAVRDEAHNTVRVDTGHMKAGLKARIREAQLNADVGWSDPNLYYAKFQEFGTHYITAHPALTWAAESERRRFPNRVAHEVRQEIL